MQKLENYKRHTTRKVLKAWKKCFIQSLKKMLYPNEITPRRDQLTQLH